MIQKLTVSRNNSDPFLQQCMSKRFDSSEQFLDLNSIRSDQGMCFCMLVLVMSSSQCLDSFN